MDANSLASSDEFKVQSFFFIGISNQVIQLNSANLKLLLSARSQITATQSFLDQSIAWLDVEIDTLQISFVASLQTKIEKLNAILLALQSEGVNSATQLSTSETTALITVISNFTSLLQGYVHSYCKILKYNN